MNSTETSQDVNSPSYHPREVSFSFKTEDYKEGVTEGINEQVLVDWVGGLDGGAVKAGIAYFSQVHQDYIVSLSSERFSVKSVNMFYEEALTLNDQKKLNFDGLVGLIKKHFASSKKDKKPAEATR